MAAAFDRVRVGLDLADGVVTLHPLEIGAGDLAFDGTGQVDLAEQRVEILLAPQTGAGAAQPSADGDFGPSAAGFRIEGPLRSPYLVTGIGEDLPVGAGGGDQPN